MPSCGRPTASGTPCEVRVTSEGDVCIWHDPDRHDEAQVRRSKGAQVVNAVKAHTVVTVDAETAPPPPETIEDAARWLSWITWAVTTGTIDGRTAHEAAYALRAFLESRKHLDDVDGRVKELATKLKALQASVS